jgi:uncharacterized protein (TIGR03437 family)
VSWIKLSGAMSGLGNGSIGFTVASNGSGSQRSGRIVVGRSSAQIAQGVGSVFVEGMVPQNGSGLSGQLTFRFNDSAGATDITFVQIQVASACFLAVSSDSVVLATAAGTSTLSLRIAGANISYGGCTIYSDGSSVTAAGNELTITLHMSFAIPLLGMVRISAKANSPNTSTGFVPVGQWAVPSPGSNCAFTLAPTGQSFGVAGGSVQLTVTASNGCSWIASSTASWLSLSQSNSTGTGAGTIAFSVAPNSTNAARTGFVMAGGQAFPVQQGGLPQLTQGSAVSGATFQAGMVPGSWALVKGSGLSNVTRIWADADFVGLGNSLPTNLSGVEVKVNNIAAAVYYIDPGQVSFQVPSGVSGTASVQVFNNGLASNTVTGAAVNTAPGIFPLIVNGTNYAIGVFLDGKLAGDPSLGSAFRKAKPGENLQLFVTGLVPTPAGVSITPQGVSGVTVTVGTITVNASSAGLTAVGEFYINFNVPNLPDGTYPITIRVNGISSPATIDSNPPGQLVLPIQH